MKLVDPSGEMLTHTWEALATKLANADENDVIELLEDIATAHHGNFDGSRKVKVCLGRDTRYYIITYTYTYIYIYIYILESKTETKPGKK